MADEIYPIDSLIKAGVSESAYAGYPDGLLTGDIMEAASPKGYDFINGNPFKLQVSESPSKSEVVDAGIWALDIAQSYHFTVKLQGLKSYYTPEKSFSEFLPVKSIQLNYASYENMSIPLAIFGDFPLLSKKRVSTISITCYDEDSNIIERQLREWINSCFIKGRYVAYMSDITRKFQYTGYNVKGATTLGPIGMNVIPTGNISTSRDYSANDAKLLNFSLICVGDGVTCQVGSGKNPNNKKEGNNPSGVLFGSEVPEFQN